ncbi:piggyBac transposable element-derived protein 3-like [Aphis craccivora]|uniref:PiggyBac transposable element-derived protein 3-like n=1 Tax=Aphis craccivora TaxID=307492 RepID=A0A6G0VW35_APHCR|nr:piggyBac transposable element-derived protein 3-like [Aphis craccivora]
MPLTHKGISDLRQLEYQFPPDRYIVLRWRRYSGIQYICINALYPLSLTAYYCRSDRVRFLSDELADFLAFQLWMGVNKLPAYKDFWSNLMGVPIYQKILRSLHFQNNDEYDPNYRFYKIRPFLNKIQEGNRYSIDEMMIPYKGTKSGSRRQYIKSKPIKWGLKFFIRAGINGQVFDISWAWIQKAMNCTALFSSY